MKQSTFFAILVVLILMGWYLLPSKESSSPQSTVPQQARPQKDTSELVNKHLWLTGQKQDLHEQAEIARQKIEVPEIGQKVLPPKNKKTTEFDLSPDALEANVYNDLNRNRKELRMNDPDYVIQSQLADQQKMDQYAREYEKAYVKEFLENARRNGYEIRLNENNEVISVRQIRQPSASGMAPAK